MRCFLIPFIVFFSIPVSAQVMHISGKILDSETNIPVQGVSVSVKDANLNTLSDNTGKFSLTVNKKQNFLLGFSRIGYETRIKKLDTEKDTIQLNIILSPKKYDLPGVTINASKDPDTVFGTWKFSVADFEFYEDKMLLLTYEKSLKKARISLADQSQKIISSFELPDVAQYLFKDYMGHVNIICNEHIYRIKITDDIIRLASLPVDAFNERIRPCIDSFATDIYFSNYSKDYPEFTYYAYNPESDKVMPFKTVTDHEQLKEYNMEYYFLKPKERLIVRKLADEYNVAAMMSGVTESMFYTALYAPLHILNDTILIFDHYSNAILKYTKDYMRVDSVPVNYHHPVKWREWKRQLFVDKENAKVYALYEKGGSFYLKNIHTGTGEIVGSYKLSNKYVDKIKIKNGYVYYVYHPFESLQQTFVYRERIQLD